MTAVAHMPPIAATPPSVAESRLDRLTRELDSLRQAIPPEAYELVRDRIVRARALIQAQLSANASSRSGDAIVRVGPATWSTPDIELEFVCSRVVNLQKLIEQELHAHGFRVPEEFGSMELQPLRARSSTPPAVALWRLLDEIETLLRGLTPEIYCARYASPVSGSIGEHVRHCLDHVAALLAADSMETLSYDRRRRGTAVESDPAEALRQLASLKSVSVAWSSRSLDEPIRVASMISPSGETLAGWSTLARELAFVVSHTIHHQAIIGVLLAMHDVAVPERFGHSPSTPRRH
jgi:uncharacterized damage-inducible protein DinB